MHEYCLNRQKSVVNKTGDQQSPDLIGWRTKIALQFAEKVKYASIKGGSKLKGLDFRLMNHTSFYELVAVAVMGPREECGLHLPDSVGKRCSE